MKEFRDSIKIEDIEGNKRYLHTTFKGCKYGQIYSNIVNTVENMINDFVCFYYPFVEENK